jgi:hypothetical protein
MISKTPALHNTAAGVSFFILFRGMDLGGYSASHVSRLYFAAPKYLCDSKFMLAFGSWQLVSGGWSGAFAR